MAAAGQQGPEGGVQGPLDTAHPGRIGAYVFEEAELPAGSQDTVELGEGGVRVGNRAQGEAGDGRVERAVGVGQLLGDGTDDVHRDRCRAGALLGQGPQARLGFDGHYPPHPGRVVGEVQPVARADLDDLAGEAGQQASAVFRDAGPVQGGPRVLRVDAGEHRAAFGPRGGL